MNQAAANRRLLAAIEAGDDEALAAALAGGADANARDGADSALHRAVQGGHARLAARLLTAGADLHRPNAAGASALSVHCADLALLHRVRQHHRRLPWPGQARGDGDLLAALGRDGIVGVAGHLGEDRLGVLRAEFARFIDRLDRLRARGGGAKRHYDEELHDWPGDAARISNNALAEGTALATLACDPLLVDTARGYFGKPVCLNRALAMRYLPDAGSGRDMFRWHHDMEDRMVKVMILLTDVDEGDQYMTYVAGSHQQFRPLREFADNAVHGEVDADAVVRATGRAGDLYLFDPNGTHSANRRADGRQRDVFVLEYRCDAMGVYGGRVPRALARRAKDPAHPLAAMHAILPRYASGSLRVESAWRESLPFPATWVCAETPAVSTSMPARPIKLLYVLRADDLDEQWPTRLRRSIDSVRAQHGPGYAVRIADYSSTPCRDRVADLLDEPCDYLHRPLDGVFNLALCRNHAWRHFVDDSDDYVGFCDIDMLLPPDHALTAWRRYLSSGHELTLLAPAYYLDQASSDRLRAWADPDRDDLRHWRVFPGGCLLFARTLFERLRGYDERYRGWGAEDEDLVERAARQAPLVVDRLVKLLHLEHPRREASEAAWRDENRARLERKRSGQTPWTGWTRFGDIEMDPGPAIERYRQPAWNGFGAPRETGDGWVIQRGEHGISLNPSAMLVYHLCAGHLTVGGVIDAVQALAQEEAGTLERQVIETIVWLRDHDALRLH